MNRLSEKCAIFLLCLPGFFMAGSVVVPVLALLAAICISAAAQLLSGHFIAWALLFCGSAACGIFPVMICALPLFLYDALHERKWWLVVPAISFTANLEPLSAQQIICMLTGLAVTLIWYFRVEGLSQSVDHLKTLHDDITEKNLQLSEQNKRLFEAQDNEVHVATLTERNRIAREIHDNVGHMLTRSILQTGALQIINKDEKLKEPLAELKNTLDGAMTSIRASVHDLHDDSIDLKRVLQEMADPVDDRFEVSLQYDAGEYIPGEIKLCIAGIVKEGISNAVKHSNGDRIDIIFREHPAFYQLLLEDNGHTDHTPAPAEGGSATSSTTSDDTGYAGRGPLSRGIGLRNMEDRAGSVGGRITFTQSEHGFRIFLTIPKGQA
ncbi:MAG: sensor histidine kinase [Lachnospiraceae bacterium]|nr:sensor histidine kinase [Lachnospiraceae bacterium]